MLQDSLSNPPCSIGLEAKILLTIIFLFSDFQPLFASSHQLIKSPASTNILFSNRNDKFL